MTENLNIGRMPPNSAEAEQGVLGSMLLSRDAIAECADVITAEYFYFRAHQIIFACLIEQWNAREACDVITFTQVLRDKKLLDGVGGAAFVTSLFAFVPDAANVGYY